VGIENVTGQVQNKYLLLSPVPS